MKQCQNKNDPIVNFFDYGASIDDDFDDGTIRSCIIKIARKYNVSLPEEMLNDIVRDIEDIIRNKIYDSW